MTRGTGAAVAIILGIAAPVSAQSTPPGRFELAIGAAWFGGTSMAPLNISETQADGSPRTVFDVSRQLTASAGLETRIGARLSPRLDAEATGSYARPQIQLMPSNDVEGAAAVTAAERLQEFTAGGAASWFLVRRDASTRTMPFITGGVSYARQLHQTSTLADSGAIVEAGGGIKRVLWSESIGIRIDIRARVRPKALNLDGRTHVSPLVGASLFLRF